MFDTHTFLKRKCVVYSFMGSGHLMENIDAGKALHRAFSVFLFNEKHELLLQVLFFSTFLNCFIYNLVVIFNLMKGFL